MGWVFSVGLLIGGLIFKNNAAFIASGLFAISGSISIWLNTIASAIEKDKDKKKNDILLREKNIGFYEERGKMPT